MTTPTGSKEEMEGGPELPCGAKIAASKRGSPVDRWTPGPWEIGDDGPILYEGMLRPVWNIYGDKQLVGSAEHFPHDSHPNFNARLIAAAPELAKALRPLAECEIIEPDAPLPDSNIARYAFTMGEIRAAKAALAKARAPFPQQPRDEPAASLKSREAPTLPSREELERALREIVEESVFSAQRFAEDTDTDYFLRWIKAIRDRARAALTPESTHDQP